MSDAPEPQPTPSDATVTSPAGAAPPMPEMRTPRHGRGRLLTAGKPGNAGGGRRPEHVQEQLIEICGLAADEMLLRLQDVDVRAKLSVDELRLILKEAGSFVLPKKFEHAGPMGGPIPIEAVENTARERLRERIKLRALLLHPPGAPAAPAPEQPLGSTSAGL